MEWRVKKRHACDKEKDKKHSRSVGGRGGVGRGHGTAVESQAHTARGGEVLAGTRVRGETCRHAWARGASFRGGGSARGPRATNWTPKLGFPGREGAR